MSRWSAFDPSQVDGTGDGSGRSLDFLTTDQRQEIAGIMCASLKAGKGPQEIEQDAKDWLRDLPPGTMEKSGWQIDQLAELFTIAALLTEVVSRHRKSL